MYKDGEKVKVPVLFFLKKMRKRVNKRRGRYYIRTYIKVYIS